MKLDELIYILYPFDKLQKGFRIEGMATTKEKIIEDLKNSKNGFTYINASDLSRKYEISRQRVWQILEELGETLHKRTTKRTNTCRTCGTLISRSAINCRTHSRQPDKRREGFNYICRLCGIYKPLSQFVKNKKSKSGYETRCLACRSAWQRKYNKTHQGHTSHYLANKKLAEQHPERTRAYYQIHRALKQKKLIKAKKCEDADCLDTRVQAVHRDYATPLDVRWLCRLHAKRIRIAVKDYTPNPIEVRYRQFISDYTKGWSNPSKWISILQKQYGDLTHTVLVDALKNYKEVQGLGRKFRTTTKAFLDEILESLD